MEDRSVEFPNRYRFIKVDGTDDIYDMIPVPGVVYAEGNLMNKEFFLQDTTAHALGLGEYDSPLRPTVDDALKQTVRNLSVFYKIGDTITTARTDLGEDWLLCNGEVIHQVSNPYPELSELIPLSAITGAVQNLAAGQSCFQDAIFANGWYVAISTYQTKMTVWASQDGASWQKASISLDTESYKKSWSARILFAENQFVIVVRTAYEVYDETDETTYDENYLDTYTAATPLGPWSKVNNDPGPGEDIRGFFYVNGTYVVDFGTRTYYTKQLVSGPWRFRSITYGPASSGYYPKHAVQSPNGDAMYFLYSMTGNSLWVSKTTNFTNYTQQQLVLKDGKLLATDSSKAVLSCANGIYFLVAEIKTESNGNKSYYSVWYSSSLESEFQEIPKATSLLTQGGTKNPWISCVVYSEKYDHYFLRTDSSYIITISGDLTNAWSSPWDGTQYNYSSRPTPSVPPLIVESEPSRIIVPFDSYISSSSFYSSLSIFEDTVGMKVPEISLDGCYTYIRASNKEAI